ncbi:flagellar FlbD family protein [Periweissella beninensis]|uniref:Flagellar FlbD family protein n=1 Tax=Periweissella beninensis TaxID=504936 RepID=A0ABT0VHT0_9LACO|nr:flagellar FlbD family protein [Periweissella beninensis]MBM7544701.1 flagellar protein FlbD [Periweissella beninensis]MCM2436939.1 flagellar FlbD family protein [Periweissella beninensis]MCT4396326.1 endoflagellar protein [Periweissella beninensis]
MIELTAFNQQTFYLNFALVYKFEATPDTVITLTDGKTLTVKETPSEIVAKVIAYEQKIHQTIGKEIVKYDGK